MEIQQAGGGPGELPRSRGRLWVARAFTLVEDVVYIGLGLLLAGTALVLLTTGAIDFAKNVVAAKPQTLHLLDRILLILLIVELLYTVQVSFREHALVPEPFLLVGLISAIRRVLLLTAEFGESGVQTPGGAQYFVIELGVLTVLIVALVVSAVLLRKSGTSVVAHRA
jgi:uncharacterized membrane protein (DUF373 family)